MTLSQRLFLCSSFFSLAYAGFGLTCPDWSARVGLDVWNYSQYERTLRQNEQELANLNEIGETIRQRLMLKIMITHDLVSKRISLAEATEQFVELNQVKPEMVTDACLRHPAPTTEESVAKQVICFARAELDSNPSLREEVVEDLEQQLEDMHGNIQRQSD